MPGKWRCRLYRKTTDECKGWKMKPRTLLLALAASVLLFAQQQAPLRTYPAFSLYAPSGSLSTAPWVVTLQLPAAATQAVSFACPDCGLSLICSAACTATVELNGSAATTGGGAAAITPYCTNGLCSGTLPVTGWGTSNSTGGAVLTNLYPTTGIQTGYGLSSTVIRPSASGVTNLTIRTTALTGTATVTLIGELIRLSGNP